MQSIPIPTDNLYKFLALFGLVLLVTVLLGSLYSTTSTNQKIMTYVEKIESIQAAHETEIKAGSVAVYEKLINVASKDRKFHTISLSIIGSLGVLMMLTGFHRWYTYYQPKHDQILELTIKKLELEIAQHGQNQI